MASLTGQSIASSYEQLLSLPDGGGNTTTLVAVTDGDAGTTFAMQLSTTTVCIDNPTADSSTQGGILRLQSDDGALMQSGSRLGVIEFAGAEDSSSTITVGARIESVTDAAWSATENGADMVFYTTDGNASQSEVMRLTADNLVGIGTSSPSGALTVQNGSIALVIGADVNGTTLSDNTRKYLRFGMPHYHTAEEPITFITGDSDGTDNIVAIGGMSTTTNAATQLRFYTAANDATTTGTERMRIDANSRISLSNNDNSNTGNTIFGKSAFNAGSDNGSDYNTIFGEEAAGGESVSGATQNTMVGYRAGYSLTSGDSNTVMGRQAGLEIETGHNNTFIGMNAGAQTVTGGYMVGIGDSALYAVATADADGSVAIGTSALNALTEGAGNVAVGFEALKVEDDGDKATAVGYQALVAQTGTTGTTANTAVGFQAGDSITTGIENTIVGAFSDTSAVGGNNQTVIGSGVTGQANNSVTLGNTSVNAVYMASDSGATVHCGQIDVENTAVTMIADTDYIGIYNNNTVTAGDSDTGNNIHGVRNNLNFNDTGESYADLTGIHNYVVSTETADEESNTIYGIRNTAQILGTHSDVANIYGALNKVDMDGGTVDANVYGIYNLIDIDGGTLSDRIQGDYLDINTTQTPAAGIRARQISLGGAGVHASTDMFWYLYDTQNGDVVAQVTALAGVATFDSGDFSGAPDYAEYFESKSGSAIAIGSTVKLDGDKIVACSDGDTPIGVIRPKSSSAVVANCATTRYQGKYLKTDYDEIILEDYKIKEWSEEITFEEYIKRSKDETGGVLGGTVKDSKVEGVDEAPDTYFRKHSYHSDRIPEGITIADDAVELTPSHQRKKLNPDYDSSKIYKNRKERDEWCLVGLLGQIPITKGQPTGSWIKMKDVSDTVEMYFVK